MMLTNYYGLHYMKIFIISLLGSLPFEDVLKNMVNNKHVDF